MYLRAQTGLNVDIRPKSHASNLHAREVHSGFGGEVSLPHLQNAREASALARLRMQNIAGARSPRGNRVEATPQGLDSNTPRPPIFALIVSPPHRSVPRAFDSFTIEAQSHRNRSPRTPHSNHRSTLAFGIDFFSSNVFAIVSPEKYSFRFRYVR